MIAKLINDIEKAFSDTVYPGDYSIASWDGMEGNEVNEAFAGKSWQDIRHNYVSELSFALIYFKPQAFHYFFPGFMIGCIKDESAEYGSCCDSILRCFIPPNEKRTDFDARMRLFSTDQFKIINRFLHYLISVGDIKESDILKAMDFVSKRIKEA